MSEESVRDGEPRETHLEPSVAVLVIPLEDDNLLECAKAQLVRVLSLREQRERASERREAEAEEEGGSTG